MAEWSHIPKDLLDQIAKRLPASIDILRIRSVCTLWRSSVSYPPHHHRLPNRLEVTPDITVADGFSGSTFFHLSKRSIYRISSPSNPQGWLIKLEQDSQNISHLMNPLSESPIHPLPSFFPNTLNVIDLQITELGQEFVLRYDERCTYKHAGDIYREKVVFSPYPPWNTDCTDFVIMTIHVSGRLGIFCFRDSKWCIIDQMPTPYDDVIHYKGKFCAVDSNGRAVVVCPDLNVKEIASSMIGGDKKCLIESDGDLLLVDRYLNIGPDGFIGYLDHNHDQDYEIFDPNDDNFDFDRTIGFKVYKLDWYENNWVEVKSLGDRVLFLGDNCGFSASASSFYECKGNCIYFTDKSFQSDKEEDGMFKGHSIGLFNMEDGSIGPLASYPGYSHVFWPPPAWLASADS